MARLIGPSEASRLAYNLVNAQGPTRDLLRGRRHRPATYYVDPDPTAEPTPSMLTQLADIRTLNGSVIADSTVTTDAYAMLPLMQFPEGTPPPDSLLVVIDGGPPGRVYAREDDRLDAMASAIEDLQGGGGGAETPAGAQSKVDAHAADTTGVHGIADTALLETQTGALAKAAAAQSAAVAAAVQRSAHTGTQSADTLTDGTTIKAFLTTERMKLTGIASGATANSTDSQLRDRSGHTGSQSTSTISGLDTALATIVPATGFSLEKAYRVQFTDTANAKVDVYFTGPMACAFEVTVVGYYAGANAAGVFRAIYNLEGSQTGTIHRADMSYTIAQGLVVDHFGLMPIAWDATNNRWKITLAHRTSTTNDVSIGVRWYGNDPYFVNNVRDSIGISSIYMTDATVVAAPATPVAALSGQLLTKVAKGEIFVNVKDFGALGNNTGNDAVGIQTALDSIPSTGGTLYFPPGVYNLTQPVVLKSSIHYLGASRFGARIVASTGGLFVWKDHLANVTIEHLHLVSGNGHIFTNADGDWGWHTSVVADCTIAQLDPTKSIVHHVSATDYDNVTFRDCNLIVGSGATVPAFNIINSAGAANENRWSDCWAHANNSNGAPFFRVESTSSDNYAYDNVFENITGEQNAGGLIDLRSNYNPIIRNCADYDTTATYVSDIIKVGRSPAVGALPSIGGLIESSGRRDNVTLPANIYDINLVPNDAKRCTVINPNHSSSLLKVNWSDGDAHRVLGMNPGKGPAGQPTDASDFLQITKMAALYVGNTTTGVLKKTSGLGTPEGSVVGKIGDEYTRLDGGVGTTFYIKETGTGNTGWSAK